jgi:hypothetical protein
VHIAALPDLTQNLGVAAGLDDRGELLQIQRLSVHLIGPGGIGRFQPCRDGGELVGDRRVLRRGDGDARSQDVDLSPHGVRQVQPVVPGGFIGQAHRELGTLGADPARKPVGVIGDEIGLDPEHPRRVFGIGGELGFGALQESGGVVHSGRRILRKGRRGQRYRGQTGQEKLFHGIDPL